MKHIYRNSRGELVPGTTTIINENLGWGKNALIHWAWQQGLAGKDYRATKQQAAEAGTIAHFLFDADLRGIEINRQLILRQFPNATEEAIERAESAYINFLEFKSQNQLESVASEVSLVSEKYQYGGTIDRIVKVRGKYAILDFKASNSIHPEYLIQLAAYKNLWEENNPDKLIEGGLHLLRLEQEAAFHHHYWHSLPEAFEAFLLLRKLHDLKKCFKGV